jgi:hypothetical protein
LVHAGVKGVFVSFFFAGCNGRACFQAEAVVSSFKDLPAVSKAVAILASPKTMAH